MKKVAAIVSLLFLLIPFSAIGNDFPERTPTPPATGPHLSTQSLIPMAISPATASDLAAAMDVPSANLISASLGTSDTSAAAVVTGSLGNFFPTQGNSFVILATGAASTAETDNNSGSTGSALGGLNNSQGQDMVQLTLELQVPQGATCLSFDFAFYSEEFPEFVGSSFNDAFTAEYGGTDLTIVNNQVVAPLNFAFDQQNNLISVNTTYGVTGNTGTTYDGATPLLRANSPIDPGASTVTVVFTIQDLGDSIYDSAVFIDNFFWGIGVDCSPGTDVDSDGDALLDDWETNGIDIDNDGTIDLDLPAMGADPQHKDIFVEVDYMVDSGAAGHSHKPKSAALAKVIEAFANAPVTNPDGTNGIRIHIDAGSDSIMNPVTNDTWGTRSKAEALTHVNEIGSYAAGKYNWSDFDTIRSAHFSVERRDVFHYCIFAHNLGGLGTTSGIARGIPAADFLVTLGGWSTNPGTVNQQAGTLMHELGHTLGLRHGGDDNANYEPNYLSIMNYSFQMRGLRKNGVDANFDYSRFDLPDLNESSLNETVGLNGGAAVNDYGTTYYCPAPAGQQFVNSVNDPIDWNCNASSAEVGVAADINKSGNQTVLGSYDDWTNLVFNGGGIGQLGSSTVPPAETDVDELTKDVDDLLITHYAVSVKATGSMSISSGSSGTYTVTIKNVGEMADVYTLNGTSTQGFVDFSSLPAVASLDPDEEVSYDFTMQVPTSTSSGEETLKVTAASQSNSNLLDLAEVVVSISGGGGGGGGTGDGGGSGGARCFITTAAHGR